MTLREIIPPRLRDDPHAGQGEFCPHCKTVRVHLSPVRCPDGKPGCLVLHTAWVCSACGRCYELVMP